MKPGTFRTVDGRTVPAVTTPEMREVDRIATDIVGLGLLQMMENAGRNLARHVRDMSPETVTVVAGNGGNGGGGLACARHLANRGIVVEVVLDRDGDQLSGATATQYEILSAMGKLVSLRDFPSPDSDVVVDALIGYGLDGPARGTAETLIDAINDYPATVVSLDVPSGIDATSGERHGDAVEPDSTLTLALPKTGLVDRNEPVILGDLAIPSVVFDRAGIDYVSPFADAYLVDIEPVT